MKSEENTEKALVVSILSLSLLTVMAGAAVFLCLWSVLIPSERATR